MAFDDFPALSVNALIKYAEDDWSDPALITVFDDQQSVEVINTGAGGFWTNLSVIIECQESEADILFAFLAAHRLRGIPFYFTHRKRGRLLVRYWSDTLPYKRVVSGTPDFVHFDLPLRAV